MAATFDINLDNGASYLFRFKLYSEVADVRTPVDMTDLVVTFRVQDAERFTKTAETLTVDNAGYVVLDMTPDQTARYLPHRRYRYNVDLIYPTGRIKRLIQGSLHSSAMAVVGESA